MRIVIIFILIMVCGCVTYEECKALERGSDSFESCQNEVSYYRSQIDIENWEMCELATLLTVHIDHSHDRPGSASKNHDTWHVRSDLINNGCRSKLGKYWIDY